MKPNKIGVALATLFILSSAATCAVQAQSEARTESETQVIPIQQPESQAKTDAQIWLKKMAHSLRHLNYQASFMLMRSKDDFEPYQWRHGVLDGVEMEHLSLLNGPGREVVRVGERVSFFEPNVPAYSILSEVIDGPIPAQLLIDPHKLRASYNFLAVGRSRVSGRAAQQIRIVSKDNSRYGVILWLDQESALPLRLDMQDLEGQTIEQLQLTSLEVTDNVSEYFSRIEHQKLPPLLVKSQETPPQPRFKLGWMPLGMKVVKQDVHRLPITREAVDYMLLSDGLIDVSIYMQRVNTPSDDKGWLTHGSDTLLTSRTGPYEVTVVGKIPANTADALAKSVIIEP